MVARHMLSLVVEVCNRGLRVWMIDAGFYLKRRHAQRKEEEVREGVPVFVDCEVQCEHSVLACLLGFCWLWLESSKACVSRTEKQKTQGTGILPLQ